MQATHDGAPAAVDPDSLVDDALRFAQQAAESTLAEATADAERIRQEAQAEVERTWAAAADALADVEAEVERNGRGKAERIRNAAIAEATKILSDAKDQAEMVRAQARPDAEKLLAEAQDEAERVRADLRVERAELDHAVERISAELGSLASELATALRPAPVPPPVEVAYRIGDIEAVVASMRAASAEMTGSFGPSQDRPRQEGRPRLSPIPLDAILPMLGIVLVLIVVLAWLG
jgi:F0F1-type ATP synthase membrane subunit b/b'